MGTLAAEASWNRRQGGGIVEPVRCRAGARNFNLGRFPTVMLAPDVSARCTFEWGRALATVTGSVSASCARGIAVASNKPGQFQPIHAVFPTAPSFASA